MPQTSFTDADLARFQRPKLGIKIEQPDPDALPEGVEPYNPDAEPHVGELLRDAHASLDRATALSGDSSLTGVPRPDAATLLNALSRQSYRDSPTDMPGLRDFRHGFGSMIRPEDQLQKFGFPDAATLARQDPSNTAQGNDSDPGVTASALARLSARVQHGNSYAMAQPAEQALSTGAELIAPFAIPEIMPVQGALNLARGGVEGIKNHPLLSAVDAAMVAPSALKGLRTVVADMQAMPEAVAAAKAAKLRGVADAGFQTAQETNATGVPWKDSVSQAKKTTGWQSGTELPTGRLGDPYEPTWNGRAQPDMTAPTGPTPLPKSRAGRVSPLSGLQNAVGQKAQPIINRSGTGPAWGGNVGEALADEQNMGYNPQTGQSFVGDSPSAMDQFLKGNPSIDLLDGSTPNASGQTSASAEALSRMFSMRDAGKQYVVYDRTGAMRRLIGPEAVDYKARAGERYGVIGPDGFQLLDRGEASPRPSRARKVE